jgi:hypothetical protein
MEQELQSKSMIRAIKRDSLNSVKNITNQEKFKIKAKINVNGMKLSYLQYALNTQKQNISKYLIQKGASINQDDLDEIFSSHLRSMEEIFLGIDDNNRTENINRFLKQKKNYLKFLISIGATTNHWMNYEKYANMFPNSAIYIKKVARAIKSAHYKKVTNDKKKNYIFDKYKVYAKTTKGIKELFKNKTFRKLPENVQIKIFKAVV